MKGKEPVLDKKGKPVHEFIYEVATWKEPFTNAKTCLVPMTAAIESSYFGTHAGNIVQFSHKDSGIFYSIGLWSEWLDKTTGEVKETFTLITDDPYKFFFDTGHDRSVFVVKDSAMEEWLTNKKFTPKERFDFLRSNRTSIDWKVENEREMAKGWQKKAPTEAELSETKVWK
jgi:putative SOS response-associated peptidase YedK